MEENKLPIIGNLHSEVLDIPIYEYTSSAQKICITMPFCTAPGAAGTIEELHAMGCNKFIICGGAGSIKAGSKVGEIIVPVSAVRDEGTSYHYLEPSREVECHKATADFVIAALERMGIPSQYYDIPLAQLLYAGDDVSGAIWDSRNWNNQKNVRSNLIVTAIRIMEELN